MFLFTSLENVDFTVFTATDIDMMKELIELQI